MNTLFKRLFEIQILHEYYLTQSDGTSIFDIPTANQETFLATELEKQDYNLGEDISIEPTESCQQFLRNYHLKFVQNSTGFIIGAEVNTLLNAAGDTLFEPVIPIDTDLTFQFTVHLKQANFKSFTNEKLKGQPKIPKIYYFNNIQEDGKVFPHLSKRVGDFKVGQRYEMGELARHGGTLEMANKSTASANINDWESLTTDNPCVNENDRYVVQPKIFLYKPTAAINTLTATLKKIDGTVVKIISQTTPISAIPLDFSFTDDAKVISDDYYVLEITGNGGYNDTSNIYLSDNQAITTAFALIEIKASPTDAFKIMESKNLVRNPLPNGSKTHPIFKVLFKSRQTYWRYKSSKDEVLPLPVPNHFLVKESPNLRTISPQKLSKTNTYFDHAGMKFFLPNPDNADFRQEWNALLHADIYVSEIVLSQMP